MPRDGDPDALDALRAMLICPLCSNLFTDPTTLPCQHTHCYECVRARLDGTGKKFQLSACPECDAPTTMKDLSVNQTLRGFVENFKSVDVELQNALATMRAIGGDAEDGVDAMEVDNAEDGATEAAAAAAKREETMRECWRLVEEIRAVDAELEHLKRRVLSASTAEVSQRDDDETSTPSAPKFDSMNLTQLRGVYRDVYGAPAPKGHKKTWFVRRFSKLDPDVVASALAATQPERAVPSIVIAYSSSARRQSGAQDERLAEVERKITAVDAEAAFLGAKDLTNECTHLIMDTGSSERVVKSRTAKYVEAIVRGLYVVHKDWLEECVARGAFGNEEAYEMTDDTSSHEKHRTPTDGPRRARECRASNGERLFDGLTIRVKGCGASLSVSAMEKILTLAGATVVSALPKTPRRSTRARPARDLDEVPDSEDEGDGAVPDSVLEDGEEVDVGVECLTLVDDVTDSTEANAVSWRWALECICRYDLLPTVGWRAASVTA